MIYSKIDKENPLVAYELFKGQKNLLAFTTVKGTLLDKNPRFTGDETELFIDSRTQLAEILGLNNNQLVFPLQTHTNHVESISCIPNKEIKEADALVTGKSNICLCVQTADCVPVLLFDPVKKVISAVHAGWKGTVGKIVEYALERMISEYHTEPKDVLAAIGPSIGPEVYEVGIEVVKAAQDSIPNFELSLRINNSGKNNFNLWEANRQLLLNSGLVAEHIEIQGECSYINHKKYYSARREGVHTGRMVSGIMLKNETE